MVNAAVERMVDAWMVELDQFVEQNLLSLDCNNTRIGSGGYGYTWDLPGRSLRPVPGPCPQNMWGCSNAQIFAEVSPEMHWEFALRHDLRWLERWGLVYYGCCEPLDRKIHLLRKIPNLRKISMSPWNNFERVIDEVRGDYVLSFKPSPAIFVGGALESRTRPAPYLQGRAGPGAGREPRGDHHEGHLHRALQTRAALGLGAHRHGGRGSLELTGAPGSAPSIHKESPRLG